MIRYLMMASTIGARPSERKSVGATTTKPEAGPLARHRPRVVVRSATF